MGGFGRGSSRGGKRTSSSSASSYCTLTAAFVFFSALALWVFSSSSSNISSPSIPINDPVRFLDKESSLKDSGHGSHEQNKNPEEEPVDQEEWTAEENTKLLDLSLDEEPAKTHKLADVDNTGIQAEEQFLGKLEEEEEEPGKTHKLDDLKSAEKEVDEQFARKSKKEEGEEPEKTHELDDQNRAKKEVDQQFSNKSKKVEEGEEPGKTHKLDGINSAEKEVDEQFSSKSKKEEEGEEPEKTHELDDLNSAEKEVDEQFSSKSKKEEGEEQEKTHKLDDLYSSEKEVDEQFSSKSNNEEAGEEPKKTHQHDDLNSAERGEDQFSREPEKERGEESEKTQKLDDLNNITIQEEEERKERREEIKWELCNVTAGPDYVPCLDNLAALRHVSTRHYEHRERHCLSEAPVCLVPLPKGYRKPVSWPRSRDKIWYKNVPHTKLARVKGHQNWIKVAGDYLLFPGGGTQFIHGALHYIDFIQRSVRDIAWGKRTRVVLDVGCGVASFGGYLFDRDVLTMSFAPKDEHEAQVQFALERGIPAISAVMGSQRLPFPSNVFDLVHCARCRVPWHAEGGTLLLELNRVLRPGGYFVWSATPVYQKLKEDVEIWNAMVVLTKEMCWELVSIQKDRINSVAAAFFRKPVSNECYQKKEKTAPSLCREDDDPDVAWYIALQTCMHKAPTEASQRSSTWPKEWPARLHSPPHWLDSSKIQDFMADQMQWERVVSVSYFSHLGVDWSRVRNVMDMRAVYGGFAAALKNLKIWVMNVVDIDSPETLPIIFDRGLFGIYHDWCESFSTYPRTYDLLHADKLFSGLNGRCTLTPVIVEIDRIVRPGGKLIVNDESKVVSKVKNLLMSLNWEIRSTFSEGQTRILCAEKSDWRPET